MTRYLLDTNIVSEPTRPRPDERVVRLLHAHEGEVSIASVVWHELSVGVERLPPGRRRDALARYLADVVRPAMPVLPFDAAAAEWLAVERARLESSGLTRPFADGMVAAVAATQGLTLVTRNVRDFDRFAGLVVEDWFGAA